LKAGSSAKKMPGLMRIVNSRQLSATSGMAAAVTSTDFAGRARWS